MIPKSSRGRKLVLPKSSPFRCLSSELSSLIFAYAQNAAKSTSKKNAKESIRTRNSAFEGLVICGRAALHVRAVWYTLRQ